MRSSRHATSGSRSGCGTASSMPSAWRPRTSDASRQLGIACSVQFSHAPSDRDLAERFWPTRVDGAYAFRSLWESGAVVANGSDAPVEELDPLAGIRAGVLRTIDDRPAWHPEQALTMEQALLASTVTPAWLAGDERRRGRLLPGYLADLVVLSRDPLDTPLDELAIDRGGGHHGRRPLGAQPAALGLVSAPVWDPPRGFPPAQHPEGVRFAAAQLGRDYLEGRGRTRSPLA